ncbi:nuclear GTP-binding protein nug1 [Malassezia brasiliensis]|uniref:Nuclear GTP-binding protein nug1 n=1 Tax=Malassezia brasiliensis TaxID=1821822 RepID=A0AAF0IQ36_9BASI|nr:nuclear GTP-binding protein nug1 [Malassezia brasiliensis]
MRKQRGAPKKTARPGAPAEGKRPTLPRRGRIACAKQTNADMLQLDRVDEPAPTTDAADEALAARTRLAQLTERDNSLKAYMKELRKVLEHADVILEVLDVRDPLGCRAYALEREAQRQGKRIVLILNKIDLVPASNTRAWLAYLRHEFPTLPFKASTQQQRTHLGQGPALVVPSADSDATLAHGAEAAGTKAILQLIKNYSRNLNLKSSITVGTIGAPNVGKSSLINSLKRSRVCSVAATPGHTKVVQGVMLDRQVRLLDSPGIVFTDANAPPGASPDEVRAAAEAALLRNVLKVELVPDPIEPVQAILNRIDPQYLADVYQLPALPSRDASDFLLRVAYQKGRIAKGALPDLDGTARSVLHDWNTGKIKYHTDPPAKPPAHITQRKATALATEAPQADEATVVSSFGEAFDLAGLLGEADAEALGGDGSYSPPAAPAPAPVRAAEPEPMAAEPDTSLGKHARDSDEESEDDLDDFRPARARAAPGSNAFAALMQDEASGEEEAPAPKPPAAKKNKPDVQFAEAEREAMATPRGKQRRKARKEKKRRAGLDVHMDVLMDLQGAADAEGNAPDGDADGDAASASEEEL